MGSYCLSEVAKGRYRFACPNSRCKSIWEYFLVRHVACLDDATRSNIEKRITESYVSQGRGYQQCPGCNTWCVPVNVGDLRLRCPVCSHTHDKAYDFCWACQREWKNASSTLNCGNLGCNGKDPRIHILSVAEPMSIDNIPGCPSIRACPKCGILIQLKGGCRRMACTSCEAQFCFICLKKWPGYNHTPCEIAPVQKTLTDPLWEQRNADDMNRTNYANNDTCVIL